jgi:hypothetical protein
MKFFPCQVRMCNKWMARKRFGTVGHRDGDFEYIEADDDVDDYCSVWMKWEKFFFAVLLVLDLMFDYREAVGFWEIEEIFLMLVFECHLHLNV